MALKEMSFMIIALAIFFSIVLLFYLVISMSGLKKDVEVGKRESSILLVAKLAGSPELACAGGHSLCVDVEKLISLTNHPEYARFWGNDLVGLRVERIYPRESNSSCNKMNYNLCSTFIIKQKTTANVIEDSSYISLCMKEFKNGYGYDQCDLGKIIISSAAGTA